MRDARGGGIGGEAMIALASPAPVFSFEQIGQASMSQQHVHRVRYLLLER